MSSGGLAIDALAGALLRSCVEQAGAAGGLLAGRRGAVVSRTARPGDGLPLRLPKVLLAEALGGDTVVAERADLSPYATDPALAGRPVSLLCAPITWNGRVIAILYLERVAANPFTVDEATVLLERAGRLGVVWPDAEPIAEPPDELPPLFVLLVEDNDINRKVAQAFLERAGHSVTVAVDGAEAVAAVEAGDFDLVLMDIRMPVMDGVEATRRIRAMPDRRKARLPILALTANFSSAEVDEYLAAGMDSVLCKPLRLGDIEEALKPIFAFPDDAESAVSDAEAPVIDHERINILAEALAPAKLSELCDSARASIAETWVELRRAWDEGNTVAAGKSAHRLAGVAANFGCAALAQLAGRVEGECREGNSAGRLHEVRLGVLVRASLDALPR
jgi:CheY-like chemotaxis protein